MSTPAGAHGTPTQVVVVGAGYAGLLATNRLLGSLTDEERAAVHLTVVNPRADFVERVRLHQLAAGSLPSVTRPLATVLHPQAELLQGRAVRIDAARRTVQVDTAAGQVELPWTFLVYAVGSVGGAPVPGAEHAYLVGDLDDAQAAVAAVAAAGDRPRLLVVGGGLTGVETAGELAEQHPSADVTLVSAGQVVPGMRRAARSAITRRLRRLGVTVVEDTAVLRLADHEAALADGQRLGFDVCLLATSFDVPPLAADSGLPVDARGRLLVDESLRSVGDPRILGAGDAVTVDGPAGARLRMACSVALPMGGHVAGVLVSALRGSPPAPFSMGFTAQCISLGRRSGYVQLVRADDSPRRLHVGGRLGARVKEAVCRRVVEAPARERDHPGAYTWRPGPAGASPDGASDPLARGAAPRVPDGVR
jgi:NADH dehydrogenase FAD-containing subunit